MILLGYLLSPQFYFSSPFFLYPKTHGLKRHTFKGIMDDIWE